MSNCVRMHHTFSTLFFLIIDIIHVGKTKTSKKYDNYNAFIQRWNILQRWGHLHTWRVRYRRYQTVAIWTSEKNRMSNANKSVKSGGRELANMNGSLILEKPISFFPIDATTVKVTFPAKLSTSLNFLWNLVLLRSILYFLGTHASSLGTKVGYLRSPAPQRSPNVSEVFRLNFIFVTFWEQNVCTHNPFLLIAYEQTEETCFLLAELPIDYIYFWSFLGITIAMVLTNMKATLDWTWGGWADHNSGSVEPLHQHFSLYQDGDEKVWGQVQQNFPLRLVFGSLLKRVFCLLRCFLFKVGSNLSLNILKILQESISGWHWTRSSVTSGGNPPCCLCCLLLLQEGKDV